DAVASCLSPDIHDSVAHAGSQAALDVLVVKEADRHRIDERFACVRWVKLDFTCDRRDADRVAVAGDSRNSFLKQPAVTVIVEVSEAEGVYRSDRLGAHRKNVTENAAYTCRRAFVRF